MAATILDKIVLEKRQEVEASKAKLSEVELERQLEEAPFSMTHGFVSRIIHEPGTQVIAEVKRRSPSVGTIVDVVAAEEQAQRYANGGAACISVLTDAPFFGGSLADLQLVRQHVTVPLLRKDFILERYQLLEARLAGADAVLLIAEILEDAALKSLIGEAKKLQLDVLLESYTQENMKRAAQTDAILLGVNNRDLHSFEVNLERTHFVSKYVPEGKYLVSESGIRNRPDVAYLEEAGIKAILVGETLMRSKNPALLISELRG